MATNSSPVDISLQLLESPETPMHVGALLIFKKPDNASEDFESKLAMQLRNETRLCPPWNYQWQRSSLQRWLLGWGESPVVDFDHHFRHVALPSPGGERELGVVVSQLHSEMLDAQRPPWEIYFIEGLYDQRFALYFKLHRAMVDKAGGIDILVRFLSRSASKKAVTPPWSVGPEQTDEGALENTPGLLDWVGRGARASLDIGQAFTRLTLARIKRSAVLTVPYTAPRTALNGPVRGARRLATQQYDCSRLERVADQAGVDVQTLVAYLCSSALRRFLKEYNALPEESLVAAVPEDGIIGGKFSLSIISLATHLSDPRKRLKALKRSVDASHRHLSALPEELQEVYSLSTSLPFMLSHLAGLQRFVPAMFNLALVNLEGPGEKLYLSGAELEALYPMSMLMPGGALTITCMRYADSLNIGLTGAQDTLPHLQRIAVYMGLALETLETLLEQDQPTEVRAGGGRE